VVRSVRAQVRPLGVEEDTEPIVVELAKPCPGVKGQVGVHVGPLWFEGGEQFARAHPGLGHRLDRCWHRKEIGGDLVEECSFRSKLPSTQAVSSQRECWADREYTGVVEGDDEPRPSDH
jgi:hypothetical protein